MSESIRRKSSSRQLLQNLISLTAQRSQEDAEEVERERRRRARETQRGEAGPSWREAPQHSQLTHNTECDGEVKPRCCLVLEEDEGFSDWSHRLENRNEQEAQDDCRSRVQRPSTQPWKAESGEEKRPEGEAEEQGCDPEPSGPSQEASTRPPEKMSSSKKEVRKSYSSTVFLSQDARGQPADRTSYLVAGTMRPRGGACRVDGELELKEQKRKLEQEEQKREVEQEVQVEQEEQKREVEQEVQLEQEVQVEQEVQAALTREWRSAEDEDEQEEEELSFTHEDKGDRHLRRKEQVEEEKEEEERSTGRGRSQEWSGRSQEGSGRSQEGSRRSQEWSGRSHEESGRSQEGSGRSQEGSGRSQEWSGRSQEWSGRSQEESGRSQEESGRSQEGSGRSQEATRTPQCDGVEPLIYGPMSPTFKKLLIQFYPDEVNSRVSPDGKCTIIERTESLRKSTSSVKKTPPPVSVSKIDKKLELYAHALEVSSKEGRSVLMDLMSPSEPVSSKKSLFEAGEAWNQNAASVTPSKDADGMRVGVANLINQWVKGGEDGSWCSSPSRPAENSAGKRYKFVVTGHGKYEKVSEDGDCSPDSAGQFYEDL